MTTNKVERHFTPKQIDKLKWFVVAATLSVHCRELQLKEAATRYLGKVRCVIRVQWNHKQIRKWWSNVINHVNVQVYYMNWSCLFRAIEVNWLVSSWRARSNHIKPNNRNRYSCKWRMGISVLTDDRLFDRQSWVLPLWRNNTRWLWFWFVYLLSDRDRH